MFLLTYATNMSLLWSCVDISLLHAPCYFASYAYSAYFAFTLAFSLALAFLSSASLSFASAFAFAFSLALLHARSHHHRRRPHRYDLRHRSKTRRPRCPHHRQRHVSEHLIPLSNQHDILFHFAIAGNRRCTICEPR